ANREERVCDRCRVVESRWLQVDPLAGWCTATSVIRATCRGGVGRRARRPRRAGEKRSQGKRGCSCASDHVSLLCLRTSSIRTPRAPGTASTSGSTRPESIVVRCATDTWTVGLVTGGRATPLRGRTATYTPKLPVFTASRPQVTLSLPPGGI